MAGLKTPIAFGCGTSCFGTSCPYSNWLSRVSSDLSLVIPIDRAASRYHLLDFNLMVLPTIFFFLLTGALDFVVPAETLEFAVLSTSGSMSR
jgi:hypothetical protein